MITFEEFADPKMHPISNLESKMARAYQIEKAQNRLAEIQSDIEDFMNIVGSHSRYNIETKLHRCKLDIAKAKSQARNTLKRATQDNPELSPDNVDKLEIVQAAFMERDRLVAEIKPLITELEKKLNRANEILEKYR
jgi:hypothetical protein